MLPTASREPGYDLAARRLKKHAQATAQRNLISRCFADLLCINGSPRHRDSHLAGMTAPASARTGSAAPPTTYTVSPMTAAPVP